MNVMKRPLFRQMGGPATPGPQDMMQQAQMEGAGVAQLLPEVERAAAERSQGIGAQYAEEMMGKLDTAEDFKTVIDAIRGNEKPIDTRYQELASYVGPEDARQTPESVLAMVQPTIMMTEEGAMDSGIGDLMQNLTTEVDMEFGDGQPTPMGQGVGSMLGAGQPVQGFKAGGSVQKMSQGGMPANVNDPVLNEAFYMANRLKPGYGGQTPLPGTTPAATAPQLPSLETLYEKSLPMYQKILGTDQGQKDLAKANIMFDIARRGLSYAGGVNPDTGQSMAGASPVAQFAQAAASLPTTVSTELAKQSQQDQAVKLAALQGAQGQYEARLKAALETFELGEGVTLFNAQGEVVAEGKDKPKKPIVAAPGSQIRDPDDPTKLIATVPSKPENPNIQFLVTPDGVNSEPFDLNDPVQKAAAYALLENDPRYKGAYFDATPSFSPNQEDTNFVINKERLGRIKDGTASEDELIRFQQLAGEIYTSGTKEVTGADGQTELVKKPATPMPQQVADVLKVRFPDLYNSIQKDAGAIIDPRVWQPSLGENNIDGAENYAATADPIAYQLGMTVYMPWEQGGQPPIEGDQIFPQYDFSKAVGFPGFYNQISNTVVDLFTDRLADPEAASALETMNSVLVDLDQLAIQSFPGRPPVSYLETFRLLNPEPGKLFVGNAANAAKIDKLVNKIKSMEIDLMRRAYGPLPIKQKQEAQSGLLGLRPILARAIIIRNGLQEAKVQSKKIDAGESVPPRSQVDFSGSSTSDNLLLKHMNTQ